MKKEAVFFVSYISEIDKNFKVETGLNLEDVVYYNVKENPWCLYGLEYDNMFRRMPKEIADGISNGVSTLHSNTSGGRLRFVTNSPYVAIVADMPDVVPAPHLSKTGTTGFDCYLDKRFYSSFIPPVEMKNVFSSSVFFKNDFSKNITINFPLYNNVIELYIGLKSSAYFKKAEEYKTNKKILYYGSSITQGACASRPGLAYPAIISNELDCDYINLGFSGSAKGETKMAEYIGKENPDVFVLDYDHNAPTEEHLKNTHEKFFKTFRKICPKTPVVIISAPNFNFKYLNWEARRNIIKNTYHNAIANGDENVYFIDGEQLWGNEWDLCTVDATHPNDLGHYKMAQAILPTIKKIILGKTVC